MNTIRRIFNKKTLKTIWIVYALFSVAIVLYLTDHMICKDLDAVDDKVILNDNWNITIDDTYYENVSLDSFHFYATDKGTDIIMQTTLPDDWKFEEPALCFHIRQTTVSMSIDNETIYKYGEERASQGKTVGSGIQLINFSNDYKGKELTIVLHVTENHAFSNFDSIWMSEWANSYRFIITENRLPFFLGSFLVVFGVAVTLILIFAVALSRKYANVLCLSIFSICMGLWTLCYHNVILVFSIPLYSISLSEYMSLTIAPIPIIGYMYGYVKQLNNKYFMLSYKILFTIQFALTVLTIYLHTKDIAHSAQMLTYYHALFAIHSFFFSYVLYKGSTENHSRRRLYFIGLAIVIASILYDLLFYILNRYFGIQISDLKGVSSMGIIIFIAILILDLYHEITLKMMEEQEKALLIKRAYTDDLTQINNRTFCTEYMDKLQADANSKYTVINFDLNDLKKTNDSCGHATGDLLIKTAAGVISEAFASAGIVCRMGGDEFIAIIPTNDTNQIESLLEHFRKLIDNTNQEKADLHLSISYGYATNDDITERNIEKVYQLADNRMYEYKKNSRLNAYKEECRLRHSPPPAGCVSNIF